MKTAIIVPELGDSISTAQVAFWHVAPGADIKAGDEIVDVVTDKASFCIQAPVDGQLDTVIVPAGVTIRIGDTLGTIHTHE